MVEEGVCAAFEQPLAEAGAMAGGVGWAIPHCGSG
jgi:hypothetical protein